MSNNQTDLFGVTPENLIQIDEAARLANVSSATIRNWIKTGYLTSPKRNLVTENSLEHVRSKVIGSDKLNKRANKSNFDSHDHSAIQQRFFDLIADASKLVADGIGDSYQNSLSESYRNKEGIYYTPSEIASSFFDCLDLDKNTIRFCDPCCGSGNFLIEAIKRGIPPENIYGYDLDPIAVAISKRRIFDCTGYKSSNIHNVDFLKEGVQGKIPSFDVIFTNPPWGKKISKEEKNFYSSALKSNASVDTCSLFFFLSLSLLAKDGYLGLLMPDSFFNVATFSSARKKLLDYQILSLVDFGKAFPTLITKAKSVIMRKRPPHENQTSCKVGTVTHLRSQKSFVANPNSILNFSSDESIAKAIERMLQFPHATLKNHARWGLGIVTGNNNKFVISEPRSGYIPVYKGSQIRADGLDGPDSFIPSDLSKYQQTAPAEIYNAEEKLVYKFISSDLVFFLDREKNHYLNSANIVIPNEDFHLNMEQLSIYLNFEVINWFFKSVFQTHKVLRSDLEKIPIYTDFWSGRKRVTEEDLLVYLGLEKQSNGTFRIKS